MSWANSSLNSSVVLSFFPKSSGNKGPQRWNLRSNFYFYLQARKKIVSRLGDFLGERRRATSSGGRDVMSLLLHLNQEDRRLADEQIIVLIGLASGGLETVSAASMMALKFLDDHPRTLQDER